VRCRPHDAQIRSLLSQNVAEGDAVVSVPESLLITIEYAKRSDFGAALQRLPIDDQSLLLLWMMADRHDAESHLASFWRALPPQITTGKRLQCVQTCS
jgi:hypothetical protein